MEFASALQASFHPIVRRSNVQRNVSMANASLQNQEFVYAKKDSLENSVQRSFAQRIALQMDFVRMGFVAANRDLMELIAPKSFVPIIALIKENALEANANALQIMMD